MRKQIKNKKLKSKITQKDSLKFNSFEKGLLAGIAINMISNLIDKTCKVCNDTGTYKVYSREKHGKFKREYCPCPAGKRLRIKKRAR